MWGTGIKQTWCRLVTTWCACPSETLVKSTTCFTWTSLCRFSRWSLHVAQRFLLFYKRRQSSLFLFQLSSVCHWISIMFSLSRSTKKSSPSTMSLTSCQSSEEFDDCCSQMASPSRFNYQQRVLALFIQNQQSVDRSSSPSPTRLDATPLGLICFHLPVAPIPVSSFLFDKKKKINQTDLKVVCLLLFFWRGNECIYTRAIKRVEKETMRKKSDQSSWFSLCPAARLPTYRLSYVCILRGERKNIQRRESLSLWKKRDWLKREPIARWLGAREMYPERSAIYYWIDVDVTTLRLATVFGQHSSICLPAANRVLELLTLFLSLFLSQQKKWRKRTRTSWNSQMLSFVLLLQLLQSSVVTVNIWWPNKLHHLTDPFSLSFWPIDYWNLSEMWLILWRLPPAIENEESDSLVEGPCGRQQTTKTWTLTSYWTAFLLNQLVRVVWQLSYLPLGYWLSFLDNTILSIPATGRFTGFLVKEQGPRRRRPGRRCRFPPAFIFSHQILWWMVAR